MDRVGSKPIITASLLVWFGIVAAWVMLAAHVWPTPFWAALALQFLMGLATSLLGLANTRLAMAIVPTMGRDHFFALFSVVGSLVLGLSPILWGLMIDALSRVHHVWHGFEVNAFSLFFAAVAVVFLIALMLCRRLDEPEAAGLDAFLRDVIEQSPLRELSRLWARE
jgi:MFS family permease